MTASALAPRRASNDNTPRSAGPGELGVYDNAAWKAGGARLSILIPTYRDDAAELVDALGACSSSDQAEIIVYDDGSRSAALTARLCNAARRSASPVRIVSALNNHGRALARNTLATHARADWRLYLDADMLPGDTNFLARHLAEMERLGARPALVVGGYRTPEGPVAADYRLHLWQAQRSECPPAKVRARNPGLYVFSCNVLAHRRVFETCAFDEGFDGWGWEDTDWGLRAAMHFHIVHIDNPAIHLGLDNDATLMAKYRASAANFARLAARHPEAIEDSPLYRAARGMRPLPLRSPARAFMERAASARTLPAPVRGYALKTWRALVYSAAL